MRNRSENAQHAVLGMIDDFNDAATMANSVVFLRLIDADQHAVAETGGFARSRFAWNRDTDLGCGSVRVLVPFVGRCDQIAVAVARRHICEHGRGQGARMMQLLPSFLDGALVGHIAQQAFKIRA